MVKIVDVDVGSLDDVRCCPRLLLVLMVGLRAMFVVAVPEAYFSRPSVAWTHSQVASQAGQAGKNNDSLAGALYSRGMNTWHGNARTGAVCLK